MAYNPSSSFFPQGAPAECSLTEQMRKLATAEEQVSRPSKPPLPRRRGGSSAEVFDDPGQ